mmetsp:Transcript_70362/g.141728  ORF Transcript_70362/g.141728 Transcript_70362/m.141728 type:complete len:170 (+) Transcript_70362:72-581(+)
MHRTRIRQHAVERWKTYHLNGLGSGVECTSTTQDGHTISTSLPKMMGGSNSAAQPVYLLLAALVGCKQATAMFVARQMKPPVVITSIKFEVKASRDEKGALSLPLAKPLEAVSRLQQVSGRAMVETQASQEEVDEIGRQVHQRCPIANMMSLSGCDVDVQWVAVSKHQD